MTFLNMAEIRVTTIPSFHGVQTQRVNKNTQKRPTQQSFVKREPNSNAWQTLCSKNVLFQPEWG